MPIWSSPKSCILIQQTVASGKSDSMGRGEYVGSNKCHIVVQEGFWARKKCADNRTVATCPVYPVRTCSLPRIVPNLPSHGGGLEHSC